MLTLTIKTYLGQVICYIMTERFEKAIVLFDPVSDTFKNTILHNISYFSMAFDHVGNNLYMTNKPSSSINVYNVKTLAMTVFYFKEYVPYYITLVPEERYGVELITIIIYKIVILVFNNKAVK